MRSLILQKVAQGVLPITVLLAIYLLLRGHNEPGGGFIAGLVTAAAIVLEALAFGASWARDRLARYIRPAFALGLLLAASAGMVAIFAGDPFFTHYHAHIHLPGDTDVHVNTALLFDIGVFMVVVATAGVTIAIFAEEA